MADRGRDLQKHAQAYVDSVLEAQRRTGHDPQVSDEAYKAAVVRAAKGFAQLAARPARADEDAIPA